MRFRDEIKETTVREKALELLVHNGFDGFSMQKLAKAATVSPATLYIYFKDKEDLITRLGIEEGNKMIDATLKGFDPGMSFADGLKVQWKNRASFCINHPVSAKFLEQIKHSPYNLAVSKGFHDRLKEVMKLFISNAIKNKELRPIPIEVLWPVIFAPLYALIQFHFDGSSVGGKPFKWDEKIMNQALDLLLRAFKN